MSVVPQLSKEYGKLVLTCALTGNLNTKERNPNLPCTPQEIADDVHKCAKAGAVFFHIHARDEHNKPTMTPSIFREICRLVKERDPDVIIQISTGGRAPPVGMDVDPNMWRINPLDLLPESGSFTPGSVNLEPIVYANSPQLVQLLAEKYRDTVRWFWLCCEERESFSLCVCVVAFLILTVDLIPSILVLTTTTTTGHQTRN